jgi:hypothetical protein
MSTTTTSTTNCTEATARDISQGQSHVCGGPPYATGMQECPGLPDLAPERDPSQPVRSHPRLRLGTQTPQNHPVGITVRLDCYSVTVHINILHLGCRYPGQYSQE